MSLKFTYIGLPGGYSVRDRAPFYAIEGLPFHTAIAAQGDMLRMAYLFAGAFFEAAPFDDSQHLGRLVKRLPWFGHYFSEALTGYPCRPLFSNLACDWIDERKAEASIKAFVAVLAPTAPASCFRFTDSVNVRYFNGGMDALPDLGYDPRATACRMYCVASLIAFEMYCRETEKSGVFHAPWLLTMYEFQAEALAIALHFNIAGTPDDRAGVVRNARNAANKRHIEHRKAKQKARDFYLASRPKFKSLDAMASAMASRDPDAFPKYRTIRDWLTEFSKELRSARKA